MRWASLIVALALATSAESVHADVAKAERTAVIAMDLGNGVPEFMRAKATSRSQDGLTAAGFVVVPLDQVKPKLPGNLATCRDGACLKQVGDALGVPLLLVGSITRKDESTIIVFKMFEAQSGDTLAEIHEVCDLCGQDELEERIGVAASALRVKAEAAKAKRTATGPTPVTTLPAPGGKPVVALVPNVVVNLDQARVDALMLDLKESLEAELDVSVRGGLEVRRAVGEVAADCLVQQACTEDIAKRLGATQILFVTLVATGNQLQVDSTWVEPASGRSVQRTPVDIANLNDAKTRFHAVAPQLLPDAHVKSKGNGGGNSGMVMSQEVPMHFTTAAKVTGAIAGVGLVGGITLGIVTRSRYGSCEDTPVACSQSKKDSIRTFGLAADASFAVAIGAAIATTVLYVTSAEKAHLVVAPTTEGGGGVTIGAFGSF